MDRRGMSFSEYSEAEERGRQMAARKMLQDPEARLRVELRFGREYAQKRYPEVYEVLRKRQ